ncbi:MAG: hypothetical protein ACPLRW_13105 [Moorellales bacterium]
MSTVFLQREGGRSNLVLVGIILAGAGAGLGYYILTRMLQPVPEIVPGSVRATSTGGVSATVRNVGKRAGYFKLQALVVPTSCQVQGISGYGKSNNWDDVLTCPGVMWIASPTGTGWQQVQPGGSATLNAPPGSWGKLPAGTYNVYLNVAVSTKGSSETRLFDREVYYWTPVTITS